MERLIFGAARGALSAWWFVGWVCLFGVCDPAQFLPKVLLFLGYVQQEYNRRRGYVQGVWRETRVTSLLMVC
jgi:hypothetical protein